MADFVRVAQLAGQALDTSQHPAPQGADTGFHGEGGAQRVSGHPDLLWFVSGRRSGIAALAGGGFAFLCVRHRVASRIVADVADVRAECEVCAGEEDAQRRGARQRFLEVLSHG